MAKLTENRMVVQPWHSLQILNLSHNKVTHLDDSLQVLPVLRELNLSHNTIQLLEVQFLCLPSLQKLNLAHNAIKRIIDGKNVLETVTSLNLSHNRLHSLDGLSAFVSVTALNLNYNLVGSKKDLHRIMKLRQLNTLCLQGNPISSSQSSRLLLLAQFLHKSRDIQLDGEAISEREQSKITSYKNRYGDDPDEWPLVQSVIRQPDSSSHSNSSSGDAGADDESDPFAESRPRPLSDARGQRSNMMSNTDDSSDTSCPNMEISWQIHAPGDYRGSPISRLSRDRVEKPPPSSSSCRTSSLPSTTTGRDWGGCDGGLTSSVESSVVAQSLISPSLLASQLHQGKNMFPDETAEERYAIGSLSHSEFTASLSMRDEPLSALVRDEPDGQSENSEVTPAFWITAYCNWGQRSSLSLYHHASTHTTHHQRNSPSKTTGISLNDTSCTRSSPANRGQATTSIFNP
ncbi:Serine/threonine-protein kinase 11-interacting protein [Geodia barretti]|nr:Serine/threonine-protein kinase 11-interacting protein [Geodia barretti]